jgi:hypothetical protein
MHDVMITTAYTHPCEKKKLVLSGLSPFKAGKTSPKMNGS